MDDWEKAFFSVLPQRKVLAASWGHLKTLQQPQKKCEGGDIDIAGNADQSSENENPTSIRNDNVAL